MQNWITTLIEGLDEYVDEEECKKILEKCGRNCITKSTIRKAKAQYKKSENIEDFLEKYSKVNRHLQLEDGEAYMVYPRCYCSFVNKIPEGRLSPTWCNCSRGWVKTLFEEVTGKQVEVILEKSVVKGDDGCWLKVVINENQARARRP